MANQFGTFTKGLFDMANAVNGTVAANEKKKADYELSIMANQMEYDSKKKLMEIQQSDDYDSWETQGDNYFQNLSNQLEDKRSPYYCRNNYMAERASLMLDNMRQEYKYKLYQAAEEKQHELRIVKYNDDKNRNAEMYTGQEYIDNCNLSAKMLYEAGDLTPSQLATEMQQNWYVGTMTNYTNNLLMN